MASAVSTEKIFANNLIENKVFTGSTSVTLAAGLSLRDYDEFGAVAVLAAKTGNGITKLEIIASAAADMSSPGVVKDSGVVAADAVGDQIAQACTAAEVMQLGTEAGVDYLYVAPRVTLHNAADVAAVSCTRGGARFAYSGLTPATTIAA